MEKLRQHPVWKHFIALNAVPRASKQEARIRQFVLDFAHNLGLLAETDAVGNVRILKKAHPLAAHRKPIALQAHLDMVHQKNTDTLFDFETQGIDMYLDGDWVKARGTTLGADNGLGVAAIMAVLESDDIQHPDLQVLFTIDEETGMTGAKNLALNWLDAPYLLNLDTEEDDEITIGCAGGIDTITEMVFETESLTGNWEIAELRVFGLFGGHSGTDIHLGRGNANKLLFRVLNAISKTIGFRLLEVDGGGLRNAIPREAKAVLAYKLEDSEHLASLVEHWHGVLKNEYKHTDPGLKLSINATHAPLNAINLKDQAALLYAVQACFNGIYRMSPSMLGLVESSSNLARVVLNAGHFSTQSLQRSAIESAKLDVAQSVAAPFAGLGAKIQHEGNYPGWTPQPEAHLVQFMAERYKSLFEKEAKVLACHAGLECGLIGKAMPNTQMVSFGPCIRHAHSPDECASFSSSQKFWTYLCEVLQTLS